MCWCEWKVRCFICQLLCLFGLELFLYLKRGHMTCNSQAGWLIVQPLFDPKDCVVPILIGNVSQFRILGGNLLSAVNSSMVGGQLSSGKSRQYFSMPLRRYLATSIMSVALLRIPCSVSVHALVIICGNLGRGERNNNFPLNYFTNYFFNRSRSFLA